MVPLLARQDPPRARLSRSGIALASRRWQAWLGKAWFAGPAVTAAKSADDARFLQQTLELLDFDPHWVGWQAPDSAVEPLQGRISSRAAVVRPPFGGLLFHRSEERRVGEGWSSLVS